MVLEVLTAQTVLVPAELFDKKHAAAYLTVDGVGCAADQVAVYSDPQQQVIAVMALDVTVAAQLEERLGDRRRFTSPLLYEPKYAGAAVWLMHLDGVLYVKVYDTTLQLAEAVPAPAQADLLYYMARLGERFDLKRFALHPAGPRAEVTRKALRRYFRNVRCE